MSLTEKPTNTEYIQSPTTAYLSYTVEAKLS